MKTILLAGGKGTRLMEETVLRPKPMVEIGGYPLLWHIMGLYSRHGYKDFVVACGYKGEVIKQYFNFYSVQHSDFVIDLSTGERTILKNGGPDWRVAVVDTGFDTMTAGRIARLRHMVDGEPFMVTYGDGIGDIDIGALVEFHRGHGRLATVTAVRPPSRFGAMVLKGDCVSEFSEKPQIGEGWINGGFFVFEPEVLDYLGGDDSSLERGPLEQLAADHQLMSYRHNGFWQPVDTLREKQLLDQLWASGAAPWRAVSKVAAGD
jgi:glucose-1-phosphate cytidylyltransferase